MTLGKLDGSFGAGGGVFLPIPGASACAVVVDAHNNVVIAGNAVGRDNLNDHIVLARLTQAGRLDATFGDGGVVELPEHVGSRCSATILAHRDGVLVLSATSRGPTPMSSLVFLDPGGKVLDRSRPKAVGLNPDSPPQLWLRLSVLAGASDGTIVAAGAAGRDGDREYFALARMDQHGGLDTSFGQAGVAITDLGGQRFEASSLLIDVDSSVLAVGTMTDGRHAHPAMLRYLEDGHLDPHFGTGGLSLADFGGDHDRALAGLLLPRRRILIAGSTRSGSSERPVFAAYHADGGLDSEFALHGHGPEEAPELAGSFTTAAQDSAGNVLLAGRSARGELDGVALTRLTRDGHLDPASGVGGVLVTQLAARSRAVGVASDASGAVVVAADTEAADGFVALRFVLPLASAASHERIPYLSRAHLEAQQDELMRRIQHEHDVNSMITRGITL